jgi:hypothetical protein
MPPDDKLRERPQMFPWWSLVLPMFRRYCFLPPRNDGLLDDHRQQASDRRARRPDGANEKIKHSSDRTPVPGLPRHRFSGGQAASKARPQNIPAALPEM